MGWRENKSARWWLGPGLLQAGVSQNPFSVASYWKAGSRESYLNASCVLWLDESYGSVGSVNHGWWAACSELPCFSDRGYCALAIACACVCSAPALYILQFPNEFGALLVTHVWSVIADEDDFGKVKLTRHCNTALLFTRLHGDSRK